MRKSIHVDFKHGETPGKSELNLFNLKIPGRQLQLHELQTTSICHNIVSIFENIDLAKSNN